MVTAQSRPRDGQGLASALMGIFDWKEEYGLLSSAKSACMLSSSCGLASFYKPTTRHAQYGAHQRCRL